MASPEPQVSPAYAQWLSAQLQLSTQRALELDRQLIRLHAQQDAWRFSAAAAQSATARSTPVPPSEQRPNPALHIALTPATPLLPSVPLSKRSTPTRAPQPEDAARLLSYADDASDNGPAAPVAHPPAPVPQLHSEQLLLEPVAPHKSSAKSKSPTRLRSRVSEARDDGVMLDLLVQAATKSPVANSPPKLAAAVRSPQARTPEAAPLQTAPLQDKTAPVAESKSPRRGPPSRAKRQTVSHLDAAEVSGGPRASHRSPTREPKPAPPTVVAEDSMTRRSTAKRKPNDVDSAAVLLGVVEAVATAPARSPLRNRLPAKLASPSRSVERDRPPSGDSAADVQRLQTEQPRSPRATNELSEVPVRTSSPSRAVLAALAARHTHTVTPALRSPPPHRHGLHASHHQTARHDPFPTHSTQELLRYAIDRTVIERRHSPSSSSGRSWLLMQPPVQPASLPKPTTMRQFGARPVSPAIKFGPRRSIGLATVDGCKPVSTAFRDERVPSEASHARVPESFCRSDTVPGANDTATVVVGRELDFDDGLQPPPQPVMKRDAPSRRSDSIASHVNPTRAESTAREDVDPEVMRHYAAIEHRADGDIGAGNGGEEEATVYAWIEVEGPETVARIGSTLLVARADPDDPSNLWCITKVEWFADGHPLHTETGFTRRNSPRFTLSDCALAMCVITAKVTMSTPEYDEPYIEFTSLDAPVAPWQVPPLPQHIAVLPASTDRDAAAAMWLADELDVTVIRIEIIGAMTPTVSLRITSSKVGVLTWVGGDQFAVIAQGVPSRLFQLRVQWQCNGDTLSSAPAPCMLHAGDIVCAALIGQSSQPCAVIKIEALNRGGLEAVSLWPTRNQEVDTRAWSRDGLLFLPTSCFAALGVTGSVLPVSLLTPTRRLRGSNSTRFDVLLALHESVNPPVTAPGATLDAIATLELDNIVTAIATAAAKPKSQPRGAIAMVDPTRGQVVIVGLVNEGLCAASLRSMFRVPLMHRDTWCEAAVPCLIPDLKLINDDDDDDGDSTATAAVTPQPCAAVLCFEVGRAVCVLLQLPGGAATSGPDAGVPTSLSIFSGSCADVIVTLDPNALPDGPAALTLTHGGVGNSIRLVVTGPPFFGGPEATVQINRDASTSAPPTWPMWALCTLADAGVAVW